MATVMKKRNAVSVPGKFKVVLKTANGKRERERERERADLCLGFSLVNSTIQMIWKNRTKIISVFERNGSRINNFESLNKVMSR
jgi:hypothetical protein